MIQYHKNAFHVEIFLSVYSILQVELYLPGLVKNHSQISALGCLESVAKGRLNNYVTLKLPFLTHLPPTITLCHVCLRESSCITSRSAQTPPPPPPSLLPIKNEIFSYKHLALSETVMFSCQHHLKTPFSRSIYWKHIPSTFEHKFEYLNTIWNSNISIRIWD